LTDTKLLYYALRNISGWQILNSYSVLSVVHLVLCYIVTALVIGVVLFWSENVFFFLILLSGSKSC